MACRNMILEVPGRTGVSEASCKRIGPAPTMRLNTTINNQNQKGITLCQQKHWRGRRKRTWHYHCIKCIKQRLKISLHISIGIH
jgi:hypothetical protein